MTFDPDAAAQPGSGIFGLTSGEEDSIVVLVPVPFDATTSYRRGAALGPAQIYEASKQVDLFDRETGRPYLQGIFYREPFAEIASWNEEACSAADPIIEAGGNIAGDTQLQSQLTRVNQLSERVNDYVYEATRELLTQGKLIGILGGDHSVPFGAICAHAQYDRGIGILHIDAHADLREAFEGFTYSHASIMHNVITRIDGIAKVVQVGVRDFGEREVDFIRSSGGLVSTYFDVDLFHAKFEGTTWKQLAARIVSELPQRVYISFDIDGLDPSFCPGTGTPVPGGLHFHEASYLIGEVVRTGRQIVGFDLNEVAPGPDNNEWNAIVGARLLYKMIGWSLQGF